MEGRFLFQYTFVFAISLEKILRMRSIHTEGRNFIRYEKANGETTRELSTIIRKSLPKMQKPSCLLLGQIRTWNITTVLPFQTIHNDKSKPGRVYSDSDVFTCTRSRWFPTPTTTSSIPSLQMQPKSSQKENQYVWIFPSGDVSHT